MTDRVRGFELVWRIAAIVELALGVRIAVIVVKRALTATLPLPSGRKCLKNRRFDGNQGRERIDWGNGADPARCVGSWS
jgi:hypothetical protein